MMLPLAIVFKTIILVLRALHYYGPNYKVGSSVNIVMYCSCPYKAFMVCSHTTYILVGEVTILVVSSFKNGIN